jgi:hypothetical protein
MRNGSANRFPGPWVDPESREEKPWLSHEGIVKFMEFVVPIAGMSERAFHLYWQNHHSAQVMNLTPFSQFMRKYTTAHHHADMRLALPGHYLQDHPFIGAAEVWLNRIGEVADWLGHPLYNELIGPDEARFVDSARIEVVVTKEERLLDPDPDLVETQLTKVFLVFRRDAGREREAFHHAASEHGRLILSHPMLAGKLRKLSVSHRLADPLPIERFAQNDLDAVFELWFDSPSAAQAFFDEPGWQTMLANESESLTSREVLALVTKVHVVHDEFSFQPSMMQPMPFTW